MKLQLTAIHLMYPVPLEKESVLKRELKQRDVVNSKCFVCESSVKSQYRGRDTYNENFNFKHPKFHITFERMCVFRWV